MASGFRKDEASLEHIDGGPSLAETLEQFKGQALLVVESVNLGMHLYHCSHFYLSYIYGLQRTTKGYTEMERRSDDRIRMS